MKFTSPELVETVVWQMRQADLGRGQNRAFIDRLANGQPPLTEQERQRINGHTNVNFLDFPKLLADARRTLYGAYLKPPYFFNVTLDTGSTFKRADWARIITAQINRSMKSSKPYFESLRSRLAMTVLHGIGPGFWADREKWCPRAVGIEDVLIPSNTSLGMDNLSHFAVWRQYTPMELKKLTSGPKIDPGWKMDVVKAALKWASEQTEKTLPTTDIYAPEKMEERWKEDLGFYGTDAVPTINAWDFYFWSDEGKQAGWRRRMILDTPADTGAMPEKNSIGGDHGQWLYCPAESRVYAGKIDEVLHFQFGDASAVAPFKYHTVRSLGWLLYSVCHLQNRLRCKLNDAIFESMMQYFRTSNPDDKERITKIDLHNFGVVPEGIAFVTQQERWQTNSNLAELGLTLNRDSMNEAAAQFREGRDNQTKSAEKTATQVMAEVNAANALVGSMLLQSYEYAKGEYREIARRFCIKNSRDMEVREFRKNCLKAGVPEEMLDSSLWNIEPEKVMGSGNKILEVAMADKLMAVRSLHEPAAQREILRIYDVANSDRSDLADRLVPETPEPSATAATAQLMLGTLLQGIQLAPVPGLNAIEVIPVLFSGVAQVLQRFQQTGMPTMGELAGLKTVAQSISQWMQMLSQDPAQKQAVKQFAADLKELENIIKGFETELQKKAAEQGAQSNGSVPAADAAKVATIIATSQAKIQSKQKQDDQKEAQREEQFQTKMRHDEQRLDADLDKKLKEVQLTAVATGIREGSAKDTAKEDEEITQE